MKLVAEYKVQLDKNYIWFNHFHAHKVSKRMIMIIKRIVELKEQGCIIKNIKPKFDSMYDKPWFYFHVRVWK